MANGPLKTVYHALILGNLGLQLWDHFPLVEPELAFHLLYDFLPRDVLKLGMSSHILLGR